MFYGVHKITTANSRSEMWYYVTKNYGIHKFLIYQRVYSKELFIVLKNY